jgi:prevent-host-death family protein
MARLSKAVNIHDAKTRLSKLLWSVERGEEITIARAGKPIARLVPVKPSAKPRMPGKAKGLILHMGKDFDRTSKAVLRDFGV